MDQPLLPLVSVVMPVYNSSLYIKEAIMSILEQSYEHFEFLIYDDGSTDNSVEIIKSIKDSRIKLFTQPFNTGYVKHLNDGIKESSGDFIARMDADDIANPERLTIQVQFLLDNPEIGVCGSYVEVIGTSADYGSVPLNDDDIRIAMMSYCPLWHPTVMFRKSVLIDHNILYDEGYLYSEDYELWTRLACVTKLANLGIPLLKYRIHKAQVSSTKLDIQINHSKNIVIKYLKSLGFHTKELAKIDKSFLNFTNKQPPDPNIYKWTLSIMHEIECQNDKISAFNIDSLTSFFKMIWNDRIRNTTNFHPKIIFSLLFRSHKYNGINYYSKLKFILRCLLFSKYVN
jgi:glycosyltransferase involved in cell wall biosynthesis